MEPVAESGHIKVQPHKIRVPNGLRRPFDRRVSLYHSVFPVRIFTGVPVCSISKHQIHDHGLISRINLPDSGRRFWHRSLLQSGHILAGGDLLHIGYDLFHKGGRLVPALLQLLPNSSGINIREMLQLRLCKKSVLVYQLCNLALHLWPWEVLVLIHAGELDRESRQTAAVLPAKPCGGVLLAGVVRHIAGNGPLAVRIPVPGLQGSVNVLLCGLPRRSKGRNGR